MTAATYRKICVASLALACITVVTGAAVRLSGSGLGCDDWPRCSTSKLVDVSSVHPAIEQINRLFTFVIGLVIVVAVVAGAFRRNPRRRDLTRLSVAIALGWPAQGLVGALLVATDLNPFVNQLHFLLSMVLVALGAILVHRAGEPDGDGRQPVVSAETRRHVWGLAGCAGMAVLTGTFVTGAGPHAGDEDAKRFDVAISTVARVHGITVMITIALGTALLWRLRTRRDDRNVLDTPLSTWMVLAVAQAGVGYTQYFSGVPAVLVGLHIALATGLWLVTVQLLLATATVTRAVEPAGPPASAPASAAPAASA